MKLIRNTQTLSTRVHREFERPSSATASLVLKGAAYLVAMAFVSSVAVQAAPPPSIARVWDEEILSAIRIDKPHPPVHARNLFTLSAGMYDAWAAYDSTAVGYAYRGKHTAADVAAARREAISYASYRILKERFTLSKSAATTLAALDARMVALGYSTNNVSTDTSTPAGVGNSVYNAVHDWFINDGARQLQSYNDAPADQGGYSPINQPMNTGLSGTTVVDVNQWQPLMVANAVDQNGLPTGPLQVYLGSQWLAVRPFSLSRTDPTKAWFDPGPPPKLGTESTEVFKANVVEVIRASSQMTPDDGATIDISPAVFGNNTLGTSDGHGYPLNPATGQPYAPDVYKRGDFTRVLSEFWADGPNSETPPGHWNTVANGVSDNPNFVKRMGGTGPVLDDLEWDVKLYFSLNAAVHDAACSAWSLKREYNGWRPISAIRYMGHLGQSSNPNLPSYNVNGLPLVPGLIELVTAESSQAGQRHEGMDVGRVAILAWPGQPENPATEYSGTIWIYPEDWAPYQKKNFVTPAFPGYVSGHSTFSRAAAEVLTAITGSAFFPGGIGTYTISALTFEKGPTKPVQLQWATYYDAADQAGLSRIWGGIHPPIDDFTGRRAGSLAGKATWALARQYFDGSIASAPINVSLSRAAASGYDVRYNTLRGFYYKLQSTPNLSVPFSDEAGGLVQATDSAAVHTDATPGTGKFYRAVRALTP